MRHGLTYLFIGNPAVCRIRPKCKDPQESEKNCGAHPASATSWHLESPASQRPRHVTSRHRITAPSLLRVSFILRPFPFFAAASQAFPRISLSRSLLNHISPPRPSPSFRRLLTLSTSHKPLRRFPFHHSTWSHSSRTPSSSSRLSSFLMSAEAFFRTRANFEDQSGRCFLPSFPPLGSARLCKITRYLNEIFEGCMTRQRRKLLLCQAILFDAQSRCS